MERNHIEWCGDRSRWKAVSDVMQFARTLSHNLLTAAQLHSVVQCFSRHTSRRAHTRCSPRPAPLRMPLCLFPSLLFRELVTFCIVFHSLFSLVLNYASARVPSSPLSMRVCRRSAWARRGEDERLCCVCAAYTSTSALAPGWLRTQPLEGSDGSEWHLRFLFDADSSSVQG